MNTGFIRRLLALVVEHVPDDQLLSVFAGGDSHLPAGQPRSGPIDPAAAPTAAPAAIDADVLAGKRKARRGELAGLSAEQLKERRRRRAAAYEANRKQRRQASAAADTEHPDPFH